MTNDLSPLRARRPLGVFCATFLLVLALSAAALASGHQLKPTEDELIAKGYRFAGEKPDDKFREIPGDETTIKVYRKGQETIALYSLPNGQVYGFAVKDGGKPITAYIDEYNTGYCDKDVSAGEDFMIDLRAYGMDAGGKKRR